MILAPLALLAGATTSQLDCADSNASLPYNFCLAEQREDAARTRLEHVLDRARQSAKEERDAYANWAKLGASSTLEADEIASLEVAQELWRVSMEADCVLIATRFKKATTSTVPHQEQMNCRTTRITERIAFLEQRYELGEAEK